MSEKKVIQLDPEAMAALERGVSSVLTQLSASLQEIEAARHRHTQKQQEAERRIEDESGRKAKRYNPL